MTEFPLFEGVTDDGAPIPAHHPFTMPHLDDLDRLESDPLSVRSQSYDLVLNGWELGSGSIRIHRADIQRRIFSVLRMTDEEAEARFGFLLGAFRYGAPPHGGLRVRDRPARWRSSRGRRTSERWSRSRRPSRARTS